jgi:hypothetical protein
MRVLSIRSTSTSSFLPQKALLTLQTVGGFEALRARRLGNSLVAGVVKV